MLIKNRRSWELPESAATPEHIYVNRRQILKGLGLAAVGLTAPGCFLSVEEPSGLDTDVPTFQDAHAPFYPAQRNSTYVVPERSVTSEALVTTYNNFYEFSTSKSAVWELVNRFETNPWTVEVTGLVHNPQTVDLDDLVRMSELEERVYRLRCVEAWAATVPWTGIPFSALADLVEPMSSATHVSFITINRPLQMPGIEALAYNWPYYEGLRIEEAMNELTMLVTGAYGKPLLRQNGAPIRLITPWKYGFKSIKSIVRIEFLDAEPPTFWSDLVPQEYDFEANVNPNVPHRRWSQENERLLETNERVPTQLYNGYEEYVAHLYT